MQNRHYIMVILPLKLEWEPCYWTEREDIAVGQRVNVVFARKTYTGVISETDVVPDMEPSRIQPILSVEEELEKISAEEIRFWKSVAEYYMCTVGEVYKAAYPKTANKILKRKRKPAKSSTVKKGKERDVALTEEQNSALSEIHKAFSNGKPVLLQGVTGSGKTEIYIRLSIEALKSGRNVLYLVPEIALSRQLETRLSEAFRQTSETDSASQQGAEAAACPKAELIIYHSGRTAAQKRNAARSIREVHESGEGGYIVLGTRSSLFLPHRNLGLIIVDEEHDSSYKQDQPAPRYNGRDTALMLAAIHGSKVILGSATPSLESLYNTQTGRYAAVELSRRYYGAEEAQTIIIDTIAERRKRGMNGNFSRKLIDRIEKTLAEGGQVAILRARRAYAPAIQCVECGDIPKCPRCSVSLSLHTDGSLICHHCGFKTRFQGRCSLCNGEMKGLGAGTQKIEIEAREIFPDARIARLDSDSAQIAGHDEKTISDFAEGNIDILIGTQILTKGFDFSGLSLVAVIQADSMLGINDFRADEKALQLLEQFRGRCGRRGSRGTLVIQTAQPEHPVYKELLKSSGAEGNSQELWKMLLQERMDFRFPPFCRIINILIKDIYEDRADRMSISLLRELEKWQAEIRNQEETSVLPEITGPYSPAVSKVADSHIRIIRISLAKDRQLRYNKKALENIIKSFERSNNYSSHLTIDVDPA